MCNCIDIEVGTYKNTTVLPYHHTMFEYRDNRIKAGLPGNGITVDTCLKSEILYLWRSGIRTHGCCCGHNKFGGYINIDEEDVPKAAKLGYKLYSYEKDLKRTDTIIPKSV